MKVNTYSPRMELNCPTTLGKYSSKVVQFVAMYVEAWAMMVVRDSILSFFMFLWVLNFQFDYPDKPSIPAYILLLLENSIEMMLANIN